MSAASFHVRSATAADLDAILALERATEHAPHWPRQSYLDILAPQSQHTHPGLARCLFVAVPHESDVQVIGFAVASAMAAGRGGATHPAELESLAVAAHVRHSGIARSLCQIVFGWARAHHAATLELEVRASSYPAVSLYQSLGFRESGRRPHYYHSPDDDALLLQLPL